MIAEHFGDVGLCQVHTILLRMYVYAHQDLFSRYHNVATSLYNTVLLCMTCSLMTTFQLQRRLCG